MEAWLAAALRLALPLWIAALGELVVQRAGLINVGIEGMMLAGAFAAFLVAVATDSPALGTLAAPLAALPLGLAFALFAVGRRSDQIVTGMALTGLAIGATGLAARTLWGGAVPTGPTWTQRLAAHEGGAVLEVLLSQGIYLPVAALASVLVAWFLWRTRPGLRLRAVGESARAAHAEGVPVVRLRTGALLFGAALAGLAGSVLTLSQSNTFTEGMTAGRGFIALTLVIFGAWRVLGVVGAALFFGAAYALQFRLQARGLDVPYPVLLMLPYLLTLGALTLASARARAPADLGRPFDPEAPSGGGA